MNIIHEELSIRCTNALNSIGINSMEQLKTCTIDQLRRKGLSKKSLDELKELIPEFEPITAEELMEGIKVFAKKFADNRICYIKLFKDGSGSIRSDWPNEMYGDFDDIEQCIKLLNP